MKLTKLITILFSTAILTCCGNHKSSTQNAPGDTLSNNKPTVESEAGSENMDSNGEDISGPSLNDIRFKDWNSEQWLDNEYIRALRQYLNEVANGKIINGDLEAYKSIISGKFVIGNIEPYLLGGAFIQIIFLDEPSTLFSAWVYSDVDEKPERVTGYEVRSIKPTDEGLPYTKEDILEMIKAHPELKLW